MPISDAIFAWLICLSAITFFNFLWFIVEYTNKKCKACQLKNEMNNEGKRKISDRIKAFLKEEGCNQADLARIYVEKYGGTFEAAQQKIHRIATAKGELDREIVAILYGTFRANIGFLITGKGEPHVKPFE